MTKLICLALTLCSIVCCAQQMPARYALRGTLVMPETLVEDGLVLVQNGLIVASGDHVDVPAGTPVIDTHAIIAPGFLDLHNHLTWNAFPRWKPNQEFGNRYDWQQKAVYQTTVAGPHAALVADGLECALQRYAEVKAMTEGETSVTGSLQSACSNGLARNIDLPGSALKPVTYNVFPLQMPEEQLAQAKSQLASGATTALLIHLAEGAPNDASAAREFLMLKARGLLLPGVTLIHAVALKPADFAEMAAAHVGMVWSPRSNVELYGDTANMAAARAAGVIIALAPDWSITGSDGMLGELNYAANWSQSHGNLFTNRDLVRMATVTAAALIGESGKLGSLQAGHIADLVVIARNDTQHDAWWILTHASPTQVALVTIDGEPVYGDRRLLSQITAHPAENLDLCGVSKALLLTGPADHADSASETWAATSLRLNQAMQGYGRGTAPLSECGN